MIKQPSILAMLAFALLALSVISYGHEMEPGALLPQGGVLVPTEETAGESGGMHLSVSAFPLQPAVPRLSDFDLQATYANGSPMEHVSFHVRLVQTEDNKVVFDTTLHSHNGQAQFSYGFNDGSEHQLEVTATQEAEDGQVVLTAPVHHEYLMEPQAQMPTLALQARLMTQLAFVFGVGVLMGRWIGGWHNARKARHAKA